MGSTRKIGDLQKTDKDFDDYINKKKSELKADSAAAHVALEEAAKKFLDENKFGDALVLSENQHFEFQHQSEFSLKNLQTVIDEISGVVFARKPNPSGKAINASQSAVQTLSAGLAKAASMEVYVAGKVMDVLSSVMGTFRTGTSISLQTDLQSKPIGCGMQLFTSMSTAGYTSQKYFNNETIFQYMYDYKIYFSLKMAQDEEVRGQVKLYDDEIAVYENKLEDLAGQYAAGKIDDSVYDAKKAVQDKHLADLKAQYDALKV